MSAEESFEESVKKVGDRIDVVLKTQTEGVAAYFDPAEAYASYYFNVIEPNPPNEIQPPDLAALTLLDIRYDPSIARWLAEKKHAAHIRVLLQQIPHDDLWTVDKSIVIAGSPADLLWHYLKKCRGIGPVIAGKLLARKRPKLIPIIDERIEGTLQATTNRYWETLRECLQPEERRLRIEHLRPPHVPMEHISTLRLLDVALWMHAPGPQSAENEQIPVAPSL